MLKLKKSV